MQIILGIDYSVKLRGNGKELVNHLYHLIIWL